jgi:hypothetical protein
VTTVYNLGRIYVQMERVWKAVVVVYFKGIIPVLSRCIYHKV